MEKERVEGRQKVTRNSRTMMMMMMDELTFAPSKKSLSMDSFWCDEMAVSGTAAALERRLRKRIIVLWTRAGDSDVDVLAARLESRRFSCVTARRIFKVFLCVLLLLLKKCEGFFGANSTSKKKFCCSVVGVRCSLLVFLKSFWKTRERQTFSRRLPFLSFLGFLHKKKAPNRSTFDIKHKHHGQGTNDANTLSMVARVFLILSRALGKKKDARGRTGGRGNVLRAGTPWCPRKKCGGRERKMFPHPFEKGRAKDECEGRAFGWTTTWCWNDSSGRVVILVARFWGHYPCHSRG